MESEKGHMLVTDNWAICLRELNLPHLPLIGYSDEPNEEG